MKHTVFGRVKSGLKIVKNIGLVTTDDGDRPIDDVIIRSCYPLDSTGNRIQHW